MFKKLPYYTPDYVVDEFIRYILKVNFEDYGIDYTYNNIFALIGLAKHTNRITEEQANTIRETIIYNKPFIKTLDFTEYKKRFDKIYNDAIKKILEMTHK